MDKAKQQKRKILEGIDNKLNAIQGELATVAKVKEDVAMVKEVQQQLAEERSAKRYSPSPSGVPLRLPENLRTHCLHT